MLQSLPVLLCSLSFVQENDSLLPQQGLPSICLEDRGKVLDREFSSIGTPDLAMTLRLLALCRTLSHAQHNIPPRSIPMLERFEFLSKEVHQLQYRFSTSLSRYQIPSADAPDVRRCQFQICCGSSIETRLENMDGFFFSTWFA